MFLTQERTIGRKLKEALLALVIETFSSRRSCRHISIRYISGKEPTESRRLPRCTSASTPASSAWRKAPCWPDRRGPSLYSPYNDLHAAVMRARCRFAGDGQGGLYQLPASRPGRSQPIVLAGKKRRAVQASYFSLRSQRIVGSLWDKPCLQRRAQGLVPPWTSPNSRRRRPSWTNTRERC